MKNNLFFFLKVVFIIWFAISIASCEKEDEIIPVISEPEVFLLEENSTLGVRMSFDSIETTYVEDDENNDVELYGYFKAWSHFDEGYGALNNYEKTESSLMWFRDGVDWYRMKAGDALPINSFTDFFFAKEKLNNAWIYFDFKMHDTDGGTSWNAPQAPDEIMYVHDDPSDANKKSKVSLPIKISVEDIEFYDQLFQRRYKLELENKSGNEVNIVLHYSFHLISMKSTATLPNDYTTADEFVEPDLYPEILSASSYAANPPLNSEALVVGQKVMSKFSPRPLMLHRPYEYHVYGINPKFVSGNSLVEPSFEAEINSEQHSEEIPWNGLVVFESDGTLAKGQYIRTGDKLQKLPKIQMVRYWIRKDVERIPAGTTISHSVQVTHGFSTSASYEQSITSSFGATAGIFSFNQEITSTFSISFSYNYSKTETRTYEISAPEDKNVQYVIWQLVEEFRIIDDEGKMFMDPSYDFQSMVVFTIPTDHIVTQAHQFSASD